MILYAVYNCLNLYVAIANSNKNFILYYLYNMYITILYFIILFILS